ncbi:uncharacterized protein K444DRAFT_706617 [Hyaloscypha bicolor E]|uniref:Uncharacterized protein n=1 Tax=Hyaloscypha bicolor E TaxID=1095630 RepID=A0A2J6SJK0_9HELO|nr:uncharacterized protein K444DRAFT_706617 [Hyaloscypha bicolor E]PMD50937.1 hypothetical protein K444DRAFT_706617 [Hyaloscypha bicolor E]
MTVPGNATGDVVRAPQDQWSISKALGVILIKYNLGGPILNDHLDPRGYIFSMVWGTYVWLFNIWPHARRCMVLRFFKSFGNSPLASGQFLVYCICILCIYCQSCFTIRHCTNFSIPTHHSR